MPPLPPLRTGRETFTSSSEADLVMPLHELLSRFVLKVMRQDNERFAVDRIVVPAVAEILLQAPAHLNSIIRRDRDVAGIEQSVKIRA